MDREKLRDIFRKYRAVGLVLLAGLLLLLLPTGKSSGQERQTSDDTQLYSLEETERRMAQMLGRMSGVGRVQVMLSLKTGPTLQLAQDMDLEQEEGSLRQRSQPVTVNRGSGWQEALVTRQDYPVYQGAVVVCQGAGSSAVRLAVTEAVAALTGLSTEKITGLALGISFIVNKDIIKKFTHKLDNNPRLEAIVGKIITAAVLLLVCGAVYMNWRYSDSVKDNKVLGQSELVNANEETAGDPAPAEDDYFATARLSRKQARDNAIHMLQEAESDENAEESVLNEASRTLQVLASYTVAESQIESLVTAKGYADCVVFMGEDSVSVVVAAPETGLNTADVARIKDIVVNETDYTPEQIKIMEAN